MRHNLRKANQRFMFGIIAMAMLVLLVAGLFLYLCLQK
jgi:uncharacterized iron-regulated membrane protein